MPAQDRANSTGYGTEPDDKARRKQGSRMSRRRFLTGAATIGVVASTRLPWPSETKEAKAAQRDIGAAQDPPVAVEIGPTIGTQRADQALDIRVAAARFERAQPLPEHPDNGDEARYPNKIASYS